MSENEENSMVKVMVVDDNTVMLGFMTTLLEIEGYDPIAVSRLEDIIPTVQAEQPKVMLLDVHLAEQDTFTILQDLKSDPDLQSIQIIAISGMDLGDQCRALGADDFVLKPFRPDMLLAKISALFAATSTATFPQAPSRHE